MMFAFLVHPSCRGLAHIKIRHGPSEHSVSLLLLRRFSAILTFEMVVSRFLRVSRPGWNYYRPSLTPSPIELCHHTQNHSKQIKIAGWGCRDELGPRLAGHGGQLGSVEIKVDDQENASKGN